jgi:hypothetical protein
MQDFNTQAINQKHQVQMHIYKHKTFDLTWLLQ